MVIAPHKERPRTTDTTWAALGQVVYAWTDKRPRSEDAVWWRNQAASGYAKTANSGNHLHLVSFDEAMTAKPDEGLDNGNRWLCRWNLRVVEKEEA